MREIPVYGMANSVNVAMALGLVGYEVFRQHEGSRWPICNSALLNREHR